MAEAITPCRYPPTRAAVFIGAAHYRRHHYGANHPLSIPRVSLTFDLINAYGALAPHEYVAGRRATEAELGWFHSEDYIRAMRAGETRGHVTDNERTRHNLGTLENPYFPGFFQTPALATGSSIQGAEYVLAGLRAFSPAGGMHHAMPDRAQGFCYFNDAVLAVMQLRRAGKRVLYLDIDAHHGDGVECAFADDPHAFTFSLHMDTRYAYPFKGGGVDDRGTPRGAHACLNVPLPPAVHDAEYALIFDTLWPYIHKTFAPDAVVLQAGTDILFADPLGKFKVSTAQFLRTVARVVADCPRLLIIGGGGYHPLMLARCWTGVWALLSGRDLPNEIPPAGQALLRAVAWDQDEDEDYFGDLFRLRIEPERREPIRAEIPALLEHLRLHHPFMRDL